MAYVLPEHAFEIGVDVKLGLPRISFVMLSFGWRWGEGGLYELQIHLRSVA